MIWYFPASSAYNYLPIFIVNIFQILISILHVEPFEAGLLLPLCVCCQTGVYMCVCFGAGIVVPLGCRCKVCAVCCLLSKWCVEFGVGTLVAPRLQLQALPAEGNT